MGGIGIYGLGFRLGKDEAVGAYMCAALGLGLIGPLGCWPATPGRMLDIAVRSLQLGFFGCSVVSDPKTEAEHRSRTCQE
jgi:hypothetical protein